MGGIFISYRRSDVSGYALSLHDQLASRFGSDRVFMDIDSIEPGMDFVKAIETALDSSTVVLVLIGNRWHQPERLANPQDLVRLEISKALERDMRIIPILFENALMPSQEDLPESIQALTRRNAVEISHSRFSYDVGRLCDFLARTSRSTPKAAERDGSSDVPWENSPRSRRSPEKLEPNGEEALRRRKKFYWLVALPALSISIIYVLYVSPLSPTDLALGLVFANVLLTLRSTITTYIPVFNMQRQKKKSGIFAVEAFNAGNWEDAERALKWLILHGRTDLHAWAYGTLGTLYLEQGRHQDAEEAFLLSERLGLNEEWAQLNREINALKMPKSNRS
jgi:hypothetical protein